MTIRAHLISAGILLLCGVGMCAKPAATITTIEGSASVLPSGGEKWRSARPNMPLRVGDQIYAREKSFVELRYLGGAVVRLNENSKLVLKQSTDTGVKSHNPLGNVWVNMRKITRKRSFEMSSPTAVAAIRGTVFQMHTAADSSTSVRVYNGEVQVGPSEPLRRRIEKMKKKEQQQHQEQTPPSGPAPVPGPEEIPGPYEVPLEQWQAIVAGQMISVRGDGKYAQESFDAEEAANDSFVRKNIALDQQLMEGDDE